MAMEYQLGFAGTPFVSDRATVVRKEVGRPQTFTPEMYAAERKQQPEIDLIEELNRLIPFQYLQDFSLPAPYAGRNVGALASELQADPQPNPDIRINDWYYPFGAGRFSVFRGLATSRMAQAMLTATGGTNPGAFVMQVNPITPYHNDSDVGSYTLATNMFMLPPRPLAEHGPTFDGLYLITLVDERFYWAGTPAGLHGVSTWASCIGMLGSALGANIAIPNVPAVYSTPEVDSQFWTNYESAPILLDAVAYNIGCIVVRNLDGTYVMQTAAQAQATVLANRGPALNVARLAGGDIFTDGTGLAVGNLQPARNSVVPTQITVSFPKYINGADPVPHFYNPRYGITPRPTSWYEESYGDAYAVTIPIASGGPVVSGLVGTSTQYLHTTAKALYNTEAAAGGDPTNKSDLTALASQLAQDYYAFKVSSALDEVYPGTFAWQPEGLHDIIWTYSEKSRLGCTRVMRAEWNSAPVEFQHATPNMPLVSGVGGPSVAQTWRDTYGNAAFGVNSVYVQQGLTVSGTTTPGGISEVALSVATSGAVINNITINNLFVDELNFFVNFFTLNLSIYNTLNVTGMSKLRLNAAAPPPATFVTINGFSGGVDGQILVIWNSGSQPILLTDSSSLAGMGNKIVTPLPSPQGYWILGPGSGVILEYDARGTGIEGFWRFDESTFMCINQSITQEAYQCRQILFQDSLGDNWDFNFGRIHGSLTPDHTALKLDWQGILGYSFTKGPIGPEPNIEVDGDEITIDAVLLDNKPHQSLQWILSTIGGTASEQLVQSLSFNSSTCVLTYTTRTLQFFKGLYQGGSNP